MDCIHLVKGKDDKRLAGFITIMNIQVFQRLIVQSQIYANVFQLETVSLFFCDLSGLSLLLIA